MRKTKFVRWTWEEDQLLRNAVMSQIESSNPISWIEIARALPGRNNKDCRKRWSKIDTRWRKGGWDPQEDGRLRQSVQKHGFRWSLVAKDVGSRSPDQCAKRWQNAVNPVLRNESWTMEEDALLEEAVAALGRNWSAISDTYFPSRSPLSISNRFASMRTNRATFRSSSSLSSHSADTTSPRYDPNSSTTSTNYGEVFNFTDLGNVIGQALVDNVCNHVPQPIATGTDDFAQQPQQYQTGLTHPQIDLYTSPPIADIYSPDSVSNTVAPIAGLDSTVKYVGDGSLPFFREWSGFGENPIQVDTSYQPSSNLRTDRVGSTMTLSNLDSETMERILHIVYRPGQQNSVYVGFS